MAASKNEAGSHTIVFAGSYGGAEEQTLTAAITRRISEHLRVNLRYAYSHYNDWTSGGNNNYDSQMGYTSLQYGF